MMASQNQNTASSGDAETQKSPKTGKRNSQSPTSQKQLEHIQSLLTKYRLKIEDDKLVGESSDIIDAFEKCVAAGEHDFVRAILKTGREAILQHGTTMLTTAVRLHAPKDILDILLAAGYSPDGYISTDLSFLRHAIISHKVDTVTALLQCNADPNLGTPPPLHEAAALGYTAIAKLLLERNADVNGRDLKGYAPIHHAVDIGALAIVKLLIEYGADVNARMDELPCRTPLHMVVARMTDPGNPYWWWEWPATEQIAILLLKNGADARIANGEGKKAVDLVASGTGEIDGEIKSLLEAQREGVTKD